MLIKELESITFSYPDGIWKGKVRFSETGQFIKIADAINVKSFETKRGFNQILAEPSKTKIEMGETERLVWINRAAAQHFVCTDLTTTHLDIDPDPEAWEHAGYGFILSIRQYAHLGNIFVHKTAPFVFAADAACVSRYEGTFEDLLASPEEANLETSNPIPILFNVEDVSQMLPLDKKRWDKEWKKD